jgi:outer membrane protein, heavy metal efflux system
VGTRVTGPRFSHSITALFTCVSGCERIARVRETCSRALVNLPLARVVWVAVASLTALGLALLTAGCARFHPLPLAPEQGAADFQGRSLTDAGLRTFVEAHTPAGLPAWPLPEWNLASLTLAAFYFHPDLDVARARWAVATAGKVTASQRPNPSLSVTPSYNTTTRIPSPWVVAPALDIPLETAGKRGYRIAQADHLSEAAKLKIGAVAWEVRSRLRGHLVELYLANETKRLLAAQRETQEQVIHLLEAQLKAGAVSPFEITLARVALQRTELGLHDAERQRGEAEAQLASAIGIPASALQPARLSFESLAKPPPDLPMADAQRQALLNRADILGAVAEYAASESALQLELAKQYPDIHLSPGYEFDQGDNKWSVGLTVTLPVLNQNQGPIAEAEARRSEAAVQFNALQARVLGELDRAAAAYRGALAKIASANSLAVSLEKHLQAGQARLQAGDISRLELTTIELEMNQAALERMNAVGHAQQAFGNLEHALQSPAEDMNLRWEFSPRAAAPRQPHQ